MAITTHPKEDTMEERPQRRGPETAQTSIKNTTNTTTAKSTNDSDGQEKEKADVTYLIIWATLTLLIIINPTLIGFNIPFGVLVLACAALQLFFKKNKVEKAQGLTHLQFMIALSYYSKKLPVLIGITALICILSTTAPIVQALYGAIQHTLSGNSFIEFKAAAYCYLAYQALYWVGRNVYTKVFSKNISASNGCEAIDIFGKKLRQAREKTKEDEDINNKYDTAIKNMRSADSITGNFWYFIQTIASAVISMTSSIISVLNFKLPEALKIAKINLTKRFFAIAVLLNLLSYWFSLVFVKKATAELGREQNTLDEKLKENSGQAPSKDYGDLRKKINWLTAIQDGFYDLPRSLCSDNAAAILIIVLTISPSFPLGTGVITAANVLTLASSLCRMMTESLVISRNINAWTKSAASFETINENKSSEQQPAFRHIEEIKTLFNQGHDPKSSKSWKEDLFDSFACILTIIFAAELACSLNGIAFVGLSSIGLMPIMVSALFCLTFYWVYQVSSAVKSAKHTKSSSKTSAAERIQTRFENLFCNTTVTLLAMRMLSMFSPYIPAMMKSMLALGLATTFWPQIVISGIAFQLFMTLLITPMLLPEEAYESPIRGFVEKLAIKLQSSLTTLSPYLTKINEKLSNLASHVKEFFSTTRKTTVSQNKASRESSTNFKSKGTSGKNGSGLWSHFFGNTGKPFDKNSNEGVAPSTNG